MSDLKFHPKAFSLVWDMKPMTPQEHVRAFRRMMAEWHKEKAAMKKSGKGKGGKRGC